MVAACCAQGTTFRWVRTQETPLLLIAAVHTESGASPSPCGPLAVKRVTPPRPTLRHLQCVKCKPAVPYTPPHPKAPASV